MEEGYLREVKEWSSQEAVALSEVGVRCWSSTHTMICPVPCCDLQTIKGSPMLTRRMQPSDLSCTLPLWDLQMIIEMVRQVQDEQHRAPPGGMSRRMALAVAVHSSGIAPAVAQCLACPYDNAAITVPLQSGRDRSSGSAGSRGGEEGQERRASSEPWRLLLLRLALALQEIVATGEAGAQGGLTVLTKGCYMRTRLAQCIFGRAKVSCTETHVLRPSACRCDAASA